MLVGAFEIQVRARVGTIARLDGEDVGRAGVEPYVEDVGNDLVIGEVVLGAEQRLVISGEPRIRATLLERGDDARIDGGVGKILARAAVDIERDRHPPSALAADHPVGAALHHRPDAVLAPGRHPAGTLDRVQRELAEGGLVGRERRVRGLSFDKLRTNGGGDADAPLLRSC